MARAHFGLRILNTHAARAAPARWNTKLFFTPAAVRAAVSKFLEKITFILVWNFCTSGLIWKRIQKTHGADAGNILSLLLVNFQRPGRHASVAA